MQTAIDTLNFTALTGSRCRPYACRRQYFHGPRDYTRQGPPVFRRPSIVPCRALEINWTDPDTLIGLSGALLGLGLGIGFPVFYLSRDAKDQAKLEYVRELNRKRFAETGEYMTDEEIAAIRQPRWTDKREFQDDD